MSETTSDFSSFSLDDFSSFEEMPSAERSGGGEDLGVGGTAIAVVDADLAVRDYLAGQLGEGVAKIQTLAEMEGRLGMGPVVVVLGPSCSTPTDFALVEQWGRSHPEVGTVLVTSELSTQLLQTALRSGVKDVLSAPIDQMQLVDTVARIGETLKVAPTEALQLGAPGSVDPIETFEGDPGKVISVFSTKGGSGKSVVATNLACALARLSDRPVVLIDAHLQFGDVAVMLKLTPNHTVVDAISQLDRLDPALAADLMTEHKASGVHVLPAPLEPTFADQITGEQMLKLVNVIKQYAGHVIIDLPAYFNDVVLTLIEGSDDVVLVAGLDIPNIKNVKIGMSTLSLLNIPKEKLHLVLNRSDSKVKLDVGEVEKTLQIHAAAHIPSDVVVPISVNKGSPVVLSSPKSSVARELEKFAARFHDGAMAEESSTGRRRFFG
jgi:pilus assembly protein CpaE